MYLVATIPVIFYQTSLLDSSNIFYLKINVLKYSILVFF